MSSGEEYVPCSASDTETDSEQEHSVSSPLDESTACVKTTLSATIYDQSVSMDCTEIDNTTSNTTQNIASCSKASIAKAGQNFCFVCGKAQSKITRHFKVHAQENMEVAQALSLPVGSKKRKQLLENLRNRGNFKHNNNVLKKGEGTLKVKRRAVKRTGLIHNNYEYCLHCKGMFVRQELWRHMRRCKCKPAKKHAATEGRERILGIAGVAKSAFSGKIDDGLMKLLSHMNEDEIARVVRNDFGLLQFAQSQYNRHGFQKTKHEYIRQKVRELGRFLLTLRKKCPSATLEDAMNPANFMSVIQAVKETAGFHKSTHSYQSPSLALKIGHSLLKVSEILHCHALIGEDAELAHSAQSFQKLYKTKWSECISHTALCTISDAKYNKPTKLPLTQDIEKLNSYLQRSAESAFQELGQKTSEHNYTCLAKLTLTRIILFNRRRAGEVSKMPLKNFLQRDESYAFEELGLSAYEKRLCKYFRRVELKGKRGRKVAVLLTPDITKALELLAEKRKECGVPHDNEFLFAIPKCTSYYRGHDCLKRFAAECGATHPQYLRSTQLRKQVATTSQILNLKNNEMDQLADFLGHNINVHREYYRLPDATVQVAKISKLLLALEQGKLPELRGKTLDEIRDFTDEDDDQDVDSDEDTNGARPLELNTETNAQNADQVSRTATSYTEVKELDKQKKKKDM
ncbi:uncharacterized protein [Sinocyclocheilus grahami]|uniref:uncharacterized protein n=1 Tax=Sinocyclocheilus grahami TaxID=75366 RepID=UPI0007AD2583|nr:PREDICTED: uncharacterized protein LOC107577374 [Sinocyclocheilus grahami]